MFSYSTEIFFRAVSWKAENTVPVAVVGGMDSWSVQSLWEDYVWTVDSL